MTLFPSITPSSARVFNPGEYPNTTYASINGTESRVRHGNAILKSTLELKFLGITEEQLLDILVHYQARRGQYGPFGLPDIIWSGVDNADDYTLPGYAWSYQGPPNVEDLPCGHHDVEVRLQSAPLLNPELVPFMTVVYVDIEAGIARAANGTQQTYQVVFSPGEAGFIAALPAVVATYTLNIGS